MKTGLVLEGGAMRGMYTAGILDEFMRRGVEFDFIVGVSAGALFGMNFLSKQIGRVIRYNKRFNSDKNYMGIRPLLREGNVVCAKYAFYDVPERLDPFDDETYMKSDVPFYAVVTDIATGLPEYVRIESVFRQMETLRASGSMPFVSRPVEVDGRFFLDGAVADSIPFEWAKSQGCDRLVVILTRDASYRKKRESPAMSWLYYRGNPEFRRTLLERHNMYNAEIERLTKLENDGGAFVFRPSRPIDIKRIETDPDKLQEVYDLGVKDATANFSAMVEYLR